jgi:hypothetical protein
MGRGMSSAGYLWKKIGAVVKKVWQGDQDAPMRILICSNSSRPMSWGAQKWSRTGMQKSCRSGARTCVSSAVGSETRPPSRTGSR